MGEVVVSVKQSYIGDKWQDMSQGGPTNHNARNISSVGRRDTLQMVLTFMYYYPHLCFAVTHLNSVISRKNKSIDFTADWGNLMQTKSNLYKLRVIILSLTMSKQAPILFELFCVCPLLF